MPLQCFASLVTGMLIIGSLSLRPSHAADWSRFRGPNGSGVADDAGSVPTTWSPTENLAWKVALPGPGSSSPIIVGDRVFVTCWSGYGTGRDDDGEVGDLVRHLLCLDSTSGKVVWDREVPAVQPEEPYRGMFAQHGYASHTPVSDGDRVYVFFGKSGALAFDMNGEQLWQTSLGTGSNERGWGSASSPILFENFVIVTAASESNSMAALDKSTGKIAWQQKAPGFRSTWGSPILVPVSDGRTDLVLGVPFEIWGINPRTGGLRWFSEAMSTDSYCSSVVAENGIVYGMEGMGGGSIAVKAGGEDDVTKSNVVWTGRHSNRIGTPVVNDGLIYFVSGKVANCIDASSGEEVYRARLQASEGTGTAEGGGRGFRGGQDYSSPIIADGKLYYVARNGEGYVLKLGKEFEQIAVNRVATGQEDFSATPAAAAGALFVRSDKHLYRISATK